MKPQPEIGQWIEDKYQPPSPRYWRDVWNFWLDRGCFAAVIGPCDAESGFRLRHGRKIFGTLEDAQAAALCGLAEDLREESRTAERRIQRLRDYMAARKKSLGYTPEEEKGD